MLIGIVAENGWATTSMVYATDGQLMRLGWSTTRRVTLGDVGGLLPLSRGLDNVRDGVNVISTAPVFPRRGPERLASSGRRSGSGASGAETPSRRPLAGVNRPCSPIVELLDGDGRGEDTTHLI